MLEELPKNDKTQIQKPVVKYAYRPEASQEVYYEWNTDTSKPEIFITWMTNLWSHLIISWRKVN